MVKEGRRAFWYEAVGHLPLQKPVQLKETSTLQDAIIAMQESGYGCIFVMDSAEKLIGLFTDKDVMEHFVASSLPKNTPLKKVMTKKPVTITPETQVARAAEIFHEQKVRHLPVIDTNGEIKGLLSVRVLMDFIGEHMPGEVLNLPPDSTVIAKNTFGG